MSSSSRASQGNSFRPWIRVRLKLRGLKRNLSSAQPGSSSVSCIPWKGTLCEVGEKGQVQRRVEKYLKEGGSQVPSAVPIKYRTVLCRYPKRPHSGQASLAVSLCAALTYLVAVAPRCVTVLANMEAA
jgi:hypothetical protein